MSESFSRVVVFTLLKWYLTFWDCFWKPLNAQEVFTDNYSGRDKNTAYGKQSWCVFTNFSLKKKSQNNCNQSQHWAISTGDQASY